MNQFMSIVSRGLLRGFRCAIDGREFLESETVSRREAERACNQHTREVVMEQDRTGENGEIVERSLTLEQRQVIAKWGEK